MHVGEYIKERRLRLGLTQQKLANLLNVSKQAVSKWENGSALPDITIIPNLAKALHTKSLKIAKIIFEKDASFRTYRFTCDYKPSFKKERMTVQLRGSGLYEVRCTDEDYNLILERYGESEKIKTVHPTKKVLYIIRGKKPTSSLYSSDEIFRLIAEDRCSLLCGEIYYSIPGHADYSGGKLIRLMREFIGTAYLETLSLEGLLSMLNDSCGQWDFDRQYCDLCELLLSKEETIRNNPLFSDSISFDKKYLFLSPHLVIQAIYTDLFTCGIIPADHPNISLLHYSISSSAMSGGLEKRDMSNSEGYLDYQEDARKYAEGQGTTRIQLAKEEDTRRKKKHESKIRR